MSPTRPPPWPRSGHERHGRLDILVNNAGIQHRVPVDRVDRRGLRAGDRHQPDGLLPPAREAARLMLAQGTGGSSTRARSAPSSAGPRSTPTPRPRPGCKPDPLARGRARPPRHHRQRPCTRLLRHRAEPPLLNDRQFTACVEKPARWPLGQPHELGGAVVFLASDAAAYVNGHVLAVDGGLSVTL